LGYTRNKTKATGIPPTGGFLFSLSFGGLRLSDSKKVLGTIDVNNGSITVQNDNLEGDIIVLQKIVMD
jgi:hypothetical protein